MSIIGGVDKMQGMVMGWMLISLVWLIVLSVVVSGKASGFANLLDTGYNQRYQDINGVSEISRQNDWVAKAGNPRVSGLTGTRDVPVFFADHDIEMQAKAGNVYNQRESFAGHSEKDCGIPGAC